jgi:hypothetical protein
MDSHDVNSGHSQFRMDRPLVPHPTSAPTDLVESNSPPAEYEETRISYVRVRVDNRRDSTMRSRRSVRAFVAWCWRLWHWFGQVHL